jgi:hypothetical protein
MVLKRIFEFCYFCNTDIDCVTWDELQYCEICLEGPFCDKCLPRHKVNAEHWKLECLGKKKK